MENCFTYSVAGHCFAISLPDDFDKDTCLRQYSPFEVASGGDGVQMCLRVVPTADADLCMDGRFVELFNEQPPYMWLYENPAGYRWSFGFSTGREHADCFLKVGRDYSDSTLYIPADASPRLAEFAINNAMMLLYTFHTAPSDTLMVHASVVLHEGEGYMFLGSSGTGKSTHSRLWLENIPDCELLNDDNPVVRVVDGQVRVYGTPWSGKTPCYKNISAPLKAVVRLSQAPCNRMTGLSLIESFASLVSACSCMRWESDALGYLYGTVEKVASSVRGWKLECLPDAEAAHLCNVNCKKG